MLLAPMRLTAGEASKLAGQLNWASVSIFKRIGRAMVRPIFDQCTRRDGHISKELERALRWWLDVLGLGLAEKQEWTAPRGPPVHLFCDASGVHVVVCMWCPSLVLSPQVKSLALAPS